MIASKKSVLNKKAQTELSFGMIFSIILIVIILSFGGYVIVKFALLSDRTTIGSFVDDFQSDIDQVYGQSEGSFKPNPGYSLSSKIEKVCLVNFEAGASGADARIYDEFLSGEENLFIYPQDASDYTAYIIENVDMEKTTADNNPFCIDVRYGKIAPLIKKSRGERLVTISK